MIFPLTISIMSCNEVNRSNVQRAKESSLVVHYDSLATAELCPGDFVVLHMDMGGGGELVGEWCAVMIFGQSKDEADVQFVPVWTAA